MACFEDLCECRYFARGAGSNSSGSELIVVLLRPVPIFVLEIPLDAYG
jgi:hypothetical protein